MTDTQRNALKIVIEAVVNGASNGYTVKVDDIVTVIEGIIEKEKETQFIPGLYPNDVRIREFQDFTPRLKPGDTHGVEQPKLWDQIVYTYNTTNTTSTTDVNSGENFLQTGENQARQMICETKQL
jgi:hypothetical protein